jgi:hypothetical protein
LFIFSCKPCLLDHHSISTFIAENAQLPLRPKQISWSQNLRVTSINLPFSHPVRQATNRLSSPTKGTPLSFL